LILQAAVSAAAQDVAARAESSQAAGRIKAATCAHEIERAATAAKHRSRAKKVAARQIRDCTGTRIKYTAAAQ
jgi:hypothetical protein